MAPIKYFTASTAPDGLVLTSRSSYPYEITLPPSSFLYEDLTFPSQLSFLNGNWDLAFEGGYLSYFTVSPTGILTLRVVDSWLQLIPMEAPMDTYGLEISFQADPGNLLCPSPNTELISFLTTNYASEEIPYPWTWEIAQNRANGLIGDMNPYVTNYLVAAQPFPDVIVNIQGELVDVQATWSTPTEAIFEMRLGLDGLALSLGESWPPPPPA